MMNNDDIPRGMPPQQPVRRPMMSGYKDNRYSSGSGGPNYNYNYNNSGGGYNSGGYSNQGQHPRRRVDRFKRESLNSSDRLLRQNDIIIRLLKEIRDRLPPPPVTIRPEGETEDMERTDGAANDQQEQMSDVNDANDQADADQAMPPLPPEP
jgi:hypothetical protein